MSQGRYGTPMINQHEFGLWMWRFPTQCMHSAEMRCLSQLQWFALGSGVPHPEPKYLWECSAELCAWGVEVKEDTNWAWQNVTPKVRDSNLMFSQYMHYPLQYTMIVPSSIHICYMILCITQQCSSFRFQNQGPFTACGDEFLVETCERWAGRHLQSLGFATWPGRLGRHCSWSQ